MEFVKFTRLKNVAENLWNSARAKFAKLDENNDFTGENNFTDITINKIESSEKYGEGNGSRFTYRWTGLKNIGSKSFNGFIEKIRLYTDTTGTATVGVYVVDANTNEVLEKISLDTQYTITNGGGSGKHYIDIEVNREIQGDYYFVVGASCALWSAGSNIYQSYKGNLINTNIEPAVGSTVIPTSTYNWVAKYEIYGRNKLTGSLERKVEGWRDLEHVYEFPYTNLLNYYSKQDGKAIGNTSGDFVDAQSYAIAYFPVREGVTYTLLRQRHNVHGSAKVLWEDVDGRKIETFQGNTSVHHEWNRITFTAPTGAVRGAIELYPLHAEEYRTMILEGDHINTILSEDIPFIPNYGTILVGSNIGLKFNPEGTNLTSVLISEAIKELDLKTCSTRRNAQKHTIGEVRQLYFLPSQIGQNGEVYIDGALYFYMCQTPNNTVNTADYPELAQVLGKQGTTQFQIPYADDIPDFRNNYARRHFICARVED